MSNEYGIGIAEMVRPAQAYLDAMRNWYMMKPKYPYKESYALLVPFYYRLKDAWAVLRGRSVAIEIS